jgi:hypothetical protein
MDDTKHVGVDGYIILKFTLDKYGGHAEEHAVT